MTKSDTLPEIVSTLLCDKICEGQCLGNPCNDRCFCTEAGLVMAEMMEGMISQGYMRMMPKDSIVLRKCEEQEKQVCLPL